MNKTVVDAVNATKAIVPGYFEKTCKQRIATGTGSVFSTINSVEEMEEAIVKADWIEAKHELVDPPCKAYKTTSITGGQYGMVKIEDQPDDTIFHIEDQKNTGMVSLVMEGNTRIPTKETWLIIGPEQGRDIVYTFHPGEPVPVATTPTEQLKVGTKLTKAEALEKGFNLAKVG